MENQTADQLTFGQQAVGITFNAATDPAQRSAIDNAKQSFADLIDTASSVPAPTSPASYLNNIVKGEALRTLMDAQMWVVKLLTMKY